jgi:Lipocalin-like domain
MGPISDISLSRSLSELVLGTAASFQTYHIGPKQFMLADSSSRRGLTELAPSIIGSVVPSVGKIDKFGSYCGCRLYSHSANSHAACGTRWTVHNHKENTMKRRSILTLSTMALLFLGTGLLPASNAVAQQKSVKEQLVGTTWTLGSVVNTWPDGTKYDPTGGKAAGVMMFDNTGHFSSLNIRSDIPKLVSNNRQEGTPEEFKAVAQGVLSYFGTYSLDDNGKVLTQHVEVSSFPNYNGTNRIWAITLTGDELTIASQAAASGGSNEIKWKRVK